MVDRSNTRPRYKRGMRGKRNKRNTTRKRGKRGKRGECGEARQEMHVGVAREQDMQERVTICKRGNIYDRERRCKSVTDPRDAKNAREGKTT